MDKALSGKVAMVTGAASGIGRSTALGLAELGCAVAVLDRTPESLAPVVEEITAKGGKAIPIAFDLMETSRCAPAVDEAVAKLGRLDILVNGAGVDVGQVDFLEQTEEIWALAHTVNLKAPMLLMQAAARRMKAQGQGGRIVNVTSSAAFRAGLKMAAYASAKAGLTQLTRNLAAELGGFGINVNSVAPGATATPMSLRWFGEKSAMEKEVLPGGAVANFLQRVADPEDVAAAVIFLCTDGSRQITGQTIHTSAGAVV